MFNDDELTEDITALIDYVNTRNLGVDEVAFLGGFLSGIAVGQASGSDQDARQRMFGTTTQAARLGAELADKSDADLLTGSGRWGNWSD